MGLEIGCRIKKRSEKCPYQAIKEAEESIERAKKILYYIEQKTKKLERALKKADLKALCEIGQECHDGFSWQNDSVFEVPLVINELKKQKEKLVQECPYNLQTCEDILYLKSSRARFLRRKVTQATSYYNEIIMILNEVLWYHKNRSVDKEEIFFHFQASSRPCLIYFDMEHFKPAETNDYELHLFYFNEKMIEVIHEKIKCSYYPESMILKGTCFGKGNETYKLVEFNLPPQFNKMLKRQMLQGIQAWIKHINHIYGRRYGKIAGSYLLLHYYPACEQMKLAMELKALGYRAVGRMNEHGNFEEKYMLIHLTHSLEGGHS